MCLSCNLYNKVLTEDSKMKTSFLLNRGELNLSSSQSADQAPDNQTIRSFVEDYVDQYVGEYSM